ncbi:FHA domain-containing protein [Halopseudomonas sp.]|uniref:FHA domain-containing protein n=1 Tax=Halopseudomonas sp. TaxID=2901191 RepID=UPI00311E986F
MELTLEVIHPPRQHDAPSLNRTFKAAGGIIGRSSRCDWVLEDPSRILSGQHAQVSFEQQRYHLTDLSSNGITRKKGGQPLPKGQPVQIEHGEIYHMGEFEIRARLHGTAAPAPNPIPDDAFLNLTDNPTGSTGDALLQLLHPAGDELLHAPPDNAFATESDHNHIESQHVRLPRQTTSRPFPPPPPADDLAEQICQRLGLDCASPDQARQHALRSASLLRALLGELLQCLRNQHQLDTQLEHSAPAHPWCRNDSPEAWLAQLLQQGDDATDILRSVGNRLRAQTLAMQQASQHCTERLPHLLAPHQLTASLSALRTDGARWRALCGIYSHRPELVQQRYRHAFNTAYQEQARLLDSLHPPLG